MLEWDVGLGGDGGVRFVESKGVIVVDVAPVVLNPLDHVEVDVVLVVLLLNLVLAVELCEFHFQINYNLTSNNQ